MILHIKEQNRRNLYGVYECEFCGHKHEGSGYDDAYFHNEVVPNKKCPACGKSTVGEGAVPVVNVPKYPEGLQL